MTAMTKPVGVFGGMHAWPLLRAAAVVVPIAEDVAELDGALAYIEPEYGPAVLAPVQLALEGRLDDFSTILLDRDHRTAYLYLTELHRRGVLPGLAPLHLFDFVADESSASRAHNEREVRGLHRHLQRVFGEPITPARVRRELDEESRLSEALTTLQAKRAAGVVSGIDAKALLSSRRILPIDEVIAAAAAITVDPEKPRPAVLLVPQDSTPSTAMHELVRDAGGDVVDEEDWYGSRSIGSIEELDSADALTDVVNRLMAAPGTDEVSPPDALLRWYRSRIADGGIRLVVAVTSPADQRRGWELPHRRRIATGRGVPFLWIHDDLGDPSGVERARRVLRQAIDELETGAVA